MYEYELHTHPTLKTSASLRNAELIRIGNGYFSNKLGNRTIASHWSPPFDDLKPEKQSHIKKLYYEKTSIAYFSFFKELLSNPFSH